MAIYEKLEARTAPSNTKGVIHWIKENLFPSVLSSILTIISLYLLYQKNMISIFYLFLNH